MVIITLRDVDDDLHRRCKAVAGRFGKSMRVYIIEAIEKCVRNDEQIVMNSILKEMQK